MDRETLLKNMELLKSKFNISYKKAKETLEKNNNDIVESFIYLENEYELLENENIVKNEHYCNLKSELMKILSAGQAKRLIVSKKSEKILSIGKQYSKGIRRCGFSSETTGICGHHRKIRKREKYADAYDRWTGCAHRGRSNRCR